MRLILIFLVVGLSVQASILKVDIRAKAAMVMNAETGVILYEKNGYAPAYPGSTTKIATAIYVLEEKNLDLTQKVKISPEMVRHNPGKRTDDVVPYLHESDGSMMGLIRGEVLTVDSLLHGLMMVSGNDAANALAEISSGEIPVFVEELNDYLARIGCKNTHFMNPHGYHHSKHQSTPYDLCLMMQRAMRIPKLVEIMRKGSYFREKTNKRPIEEMKTSNFLIRPEKKYYYPKAIAGKTGFHSKAGSCLVSVAEHDGRKLIACVLGNEKDGGRFEDSKKLFEAAFAEKKMKRIYVPMGGRFTRVLEGAKAPLKATLLKDVSLEYYPAEEPQVKAYANWAPPAFPIQKGAVVGEVCLVDQAGVVLASENILASEAVTTTFFHALKSKWNKLFPLQRP